jgi:competence protein ComEA
LLQEAIREAGGPKRVAAAGLACVAVVVLVVGAYSRGGDEGPGTEVVMAGMAGDAAPGDGNVQSGAGPKVTVDETSGAPTELLVHVAGAVRQPGLVRLPPGARVADAVRAAGGASPGADVSALNLAALVADADKIQVPKRGEAPVQPPAGGTGVSGGTGRAGAAAGAPVDLNAAGAQELDALPGIGPVLAQRIVDFRTSKGRFASVDDLRQVEGIGPKKFEQLKPLLVVR